MKSYIATKLSFLSLFLFIGCAQNSYLSQSKSKSENLFLTESMSRHAEIDLEKMAQQKNLHLKSLGQCHLGNEEHGINIMKEALDQNLTDERYWNSIGVCYYLNKNYKRAAFFYKLSLQVAKSKKITFSLPYNNIAIIYTHTRQYDLAFDYFTKAIQLNSTTVVAKFNLSQLFLKKYLPKKAKAILEKLLKKAPDDIELISSIGFASLLMGDMKKALNHFSQLPKLARKRQDISSYIALAYFLSGEYARTLETLKRQETISLREFRQMSKKLKELAMSRMKQRGQSWKSRKK